MAKPRRSSPARDVLFRVDEADAKRAEAAALEATRETSKIVPVPEMYRRAYLAGLALVESCAGCRAGTCDGLAHLRQSKPSVTPNVLKHEPLDKLAEIHEDLPQPAVPKSVETAAAEQVGMFFTEPTEDKPAPEPKKRTRKPRVVTEDSPEHARLVDVYHVEFVRVRSEKPAYTSRDFAAFRALLKTHGFDRACELIKNAFSDPWWSKRVTIQKINADPSTFAGTSAPVAVRRSGTTQDEMPEAWS